ncbi:MAG: hypothetical protein Q8R48_07590 [Candidatus Omnitrophota bacterium]|nr:hypothetical protein [Candidatus Omnitrophota bacterium]
MRVPKITEAIKRIADLLPKSNIEKIVLKTLVAIWVVTLIAVVGLKAFKGTRDGIEKKISEMATNMRISPSVSPGEIKKYETILTQAEYPAPKDTYAKDAKRDPFSKYNPEIAPVDAVKVTAHDFVLRSIGNVPLPIMYKGYIEMPDKLIGQVNWKDATRFVEDGGALNGYKIQRVTKDRVEATDADGRKINFLLNKPILSDKLNAVLYDNISQKVYTVETATVIDDYKVIDIQPDYVILLSKGSEIKLTK